MNAGVPISIVTISRECGAGGHTTGRQLERRLGWRFWDKETYHAESKLLGAPNDDLIELAEHDAESVRERLRNSPSHRAYLASLKEWVDHIGDQGRTIAIGRGASILLRNHAGTLHTRLVAPLDVRAGRLRAVDRSLPLEAATLKCQQVDAARDRFMRALFGEDVANVLNYSVTVNTSGFPPRAIAELIAFLVDRPPTTPPDGRPQIITLSSQLGSRETDLGRELARRLGLKLWDRERLARDAGLPDATDADLGQLDSQAFDVLRKTMDHVVQSGGGIVIGRGAGEFLKHSAGALRVKLVAPMGERIRRVAEYRWIDANAAEAAIHASDASRRAFYQRYFGMDWDDPLNFDLVLNTAALGPLTPDLVTRATAMRVLPTLQDSEGVIAMRPPSRP